MARDITGGRAQWPFADRVFAAGLAFVFAAGLVATVGGGLAMSGMGTTPMPGGWRLSATWAPMCGQDWVGAAGSFLAMWMAMTAAMMLPAAGPALRRDGRAAFVLGYLAVWLAVGAAVFPLGAALAWAAMREAALAQAMPFVGGGVVVAAGALQFTAWKARRLACCRAPCRPAGAGWRDGVRLGVHCSACCAGPTAALLALGVMDLRAMAVVTAAIVLERLAPGTWAARALGAVAVAGGGVLLGLAVGRA